MDLRALGINIANQALRNGFHLKGIHADRQRLQLMYGGLDGLAETVQSAFAHAAAGFSIAPATRSAHRNPTICIDI